MELALLSKSNLTWAIHKISKAALSPVGDYLSIRPIRMVSPRSARDSYWLGRAQRQLAKMDR